MEPAQKPVVEGPTVNKEQIKELLRTSSGQFHIVDVREHAEVAATGLIPTSQHIPRSSLLSSSSLLRLCGRLTRSKQWERFPTP